LHIDLRTWNGFDPRTSRETGCQQRKPAFHKICFTALVLGWLDEQKLIRRKVAKDEWRLRLPAVATICRFPSDCHRFDPIEMKNQKLAFHPYFMQGSL